MQDTSGNNPLSSQVYLPGKWVIQKKISHPPRLNVTPSRMTTQHFSRYIKNKKLRKVNNKSTSKFSVYSETSVLHP
jgi:hypothetical protein